VACQDEEPTTPLPEQPIDYVALGDSYTAAPLVPTTDTSDTCLRSTGNYPHLIAAQLSGRLDDVSCSGADTTDVVGRQVNHGQTKPPQIDAVTARTDLVTIGLGGNDLSLFGQMVVGCLQLRQSDPQGAPCRDGNRRGTGDRLLDRIPKIQDRLGRVIERVRERAARPTRPW
jgi:lysophospholipase L1-like esterase